MESTNLSSLQTNESLQTRSADKILSADEARLQIDECNLQTKSSLQTNESLQTVTVFYTVCSA